MEDILKLECEKQMEIYKLLKYIEKKCIDEFDEYKELKLRCKENQEIIEFYNKRDTKKKMENIMKIKRKIFSKTN